MTEHIERVKIIFFDTFIMVSEGDFEKYLKERIKVDGKTGNLGEKVKVLS